MKKLTIAIDCDDVIVPTVPLILNYYNKTYGTHLTLKDAYSTDPALWGVSHESIAIKRAEAYMATDEYQNVHPFLDAIRTIPKLAQHHELHVVTGRASFLTSATTAMLDAYFPGMFQSIEFTNFFRKNARSKADVCRDLNVDLLIDDHLHHAAVVAERGIDALLFGDYPWNQANQLPANVRRAKDWRRVEQLLLEVATV